MEEEICSIKRRELNSYNRRKDDQGGKVFTFRIDIKKEFCWGKNELKGDLEVAEFLM